MSRKRQIIDDILSFARDLSLADQNTVLEYLVSFDSIDEMTSADLRGIFSFIESFGMYDDAEAQILSADIEELEGQERYLDFLATDTDFDADDIDERNALGNEFYGVEVLTDELRELIPPADLRAEGKNFISIDDAVIYAAEIPVPTRIYVTAYGTYIVEVLYP